MKKLAIVALVALAMMLGNCASNTVAPPPTTGAGGNWEAQLVGGTGEAALLDFVTNFSVGYHGGGLTINSFSFFNTNACFSTLTGESGTAFLNTSASGQVTGTLTYMITGTATSSGSTSTNTLTLTSYQPVGLTGTSSGTSGNTSLSNGVVTGTWSLSGSTACSGFSGTFIMCQETANCTPPN
jgi:predicted small secreted protein